MGYIILASGLVLIVTAWACYHNPNLINPYGNMSPERKALVDIEGLKKACAIILSVTGILLVVISTLLLLNVINEDFGVWSLMILVLAMIVPLFLAMKKYNGFGRDRSGVLPRYSKSGKSAKMALVISALSVVFVIIILLLANKTSKIEVNEESVSISGMYGRDIPFSEIVSVELLEKMPPIAMRTNGSSTGMYQKGHFRLKNGQNCLLFIRNQAPFIEVRTNDNLYYFNRDSEQETLELFSKVKEKTPVLP